jgi:glycosyltransferase involved in cell wall biosynthesis
MTDAALRVSVVLTCYNEGHTIGTAVRSVLEQTRADLIDAIVIADDGSNPETIGVLREIEHWDSRILVQYGAGGAGLAAQRNSGIESTTAPFVAILDGDDFWVPNKLELQLTSLISDPNVGLVYSGYYTFARDDSSTAARARVRDITGHSDLTRAYFLNDPPIIPSTTLIRRSAFRACGGYDARVQVFEDTDFYLRLSRVCRFALVNAPLLYKRTNSVGITGSRKDLLAHHALVALKAAAEEPRLLPLVPRRLSERARKLGNYRFLSGDIEEARRLLWFAVRLSPTSAQAWGSLFAMTRIARPLQRLFASRLLARRVAMGVTEPVH